MIKKILVYLIFMPTMYAQQESQSLLRPTQEIAEKLTPFKLACKKSRTDILQGYLTEQSYQQMLQTISAPEYSSLRNNLKNNYYNQWDAAEIGYRAGTAMAVSIWASSIAIGFTAFASSFFVDNDDDLQKILTVEKYCLGTALLNCIAYPIMGTAAGAAVHLRNRFVDYKNCKITAILNMMTALRQQNAANIRMETIIKVEND